MALSDLYGKILAMGVNVMRRHTVMPLLVNKVSPEDPATMHSRGGVVEVTVPPEFQTRTVIPGPIPPASQGGPSPSTVQVPLDFWEEVNFPLTQRDITQLENNDAYVPMFLENAGAKLASRISESILQQYPGIYGAVGAANAVPFAASTAEVQAAKATLTRQTAPKDMRQIVLETDAYSNATGLPAFAYANRYGSDETVREGELGRAYGFNWHEDLNVQTHTGNSPTGWLVNQANHAAGDAQVGIDTGTGAPVVGDIFTVAGDSQTYVVTGFTGGTLSYQPAARLGWADDAAIAFVGDHKVHLAFHPMAFAFSSRPEAQLNLPELRQGQVLGTWVDPMTGVALRLEIKNEYHQTGFYLSCLWGTRLIDPRLAVRVIGQPS